jgi:hyaluronan synthase
VQVAGWKEDEHYFKDCLRSITDVKYENVKRAIVVVDGCEEDDEYMGNCCEEVFGSRVRVVHLPKLLDPDDEEQNEKLFKEYVDPYDNYPVLAILQPHHSKRSAIYTAVRISIRKKYDLQFNTDSDTIIKPDCIGYLVDVVESRPDAGAVAGSLEIFNAGESLLARLSHARYYMAFQIERCAQSFFGCVDCISGPCGIYRTDVLRRIIDGWYTQEFMGKRTTSGDDRHLSNRVLSTGRRIYFSHLAACRTETPTTLGRWMKQQCRWMRSAIREAGYELFYVIHKQSLFLSWTLSFYQLYAFALVITLVLLFYRDHTVLSVCSIFIASMVIPTVRSVFVYIFMDRKRPDVFLMALYGPLFILTLIPIKFYAIATLGETSWFTSARKSTLFSNKCDMLYVWVLGWIVFLIVGAFLKVVS